MVSEGIKRNGPPRPLARHAKTACKSTRSLPQNTEELRGKRSPIDALAFGRGAIKYICNVQHGTQHLHPICIWPGSKESGHLSEIGPLRFRNSNGDLAHQFGSVPFFGASLFATNLQNTFSIDGRNPTAAISRQLPGPPVDVGAHDDPELFFPERHPSLGLSFIAYFKLQI